MGIRPAPGGRRRGWTPAPPAGRPSGRWGRRAAPAASTEHSTSAAAWLTVHWVECHLLYGKARGRFDVDGVRIESASIGAGNAASGLARATRLKRAHRSATSSRCAGQGRPSAARRALSIMAYCWTGSQRRWATSTGSSSGPARRRVTSGTAPAWSVSTALATRALEVPGPPLGLAAHHHGHVGLAGDDGGERLVDQATAGGCPAPPGGSGLAGAHCGGHQSSRVGIRPAPLGDGDPVDPLEESRPGPASSAAACNALIISSVASASAEAVPTPTRTGVRGSRDSSVGVREHGHRAPGRRDRGRTPAGRRDPPGPHHPTHLAPGDRDGAQVQRLLSGPLGYVVVGLMGTALLVLEPLAPHAQPDGEVVELLVAVGHQVRPSVLDRAQTGGLPPVVEVDGHGRRGRGLRRPGRRRRRA